MKKLEELASSELTPDEGRGNTAQISSVTATSTRKRNRHAHGRRACPGASSARAVRSRFPAFHSDSISTQPWHPVAQWRELLRRHGSRAPAPLFPEFRPGKPGAAGGHLS